MNCPNCGKWNPDDKNYCWHCQAELPRPVEKKKKGQPTVFLGLPVWTWLVLVGLAVFWFLSSLLPTLVGR